MTETVKLRPPRLEATLAPATASAEARTVEMQFYSGAEVRRYSWTRGEYLLRFSMDPAHVRLGQLNSGRAPLLESHSDYSTTDVLGVIESAKIQDGKGLATARFAEGDPAAELVWNKVQQGILRNVSMGVSIHKLQQLSKDEDKIQSYLAIDWEPQEISVVPIGADPGAQLLAAELASEVEVEVLRAEGATAQEESTMETQTTGAGAAQTQNPAVDAQAVLAAERARTTALTAAHQQFVQMGGDGAALPLATHLANGTAVDEFRRLAFEALAARAALQPGTQTHRVETVRDERDTRRELAGEVVSNLMHRSAVVRPDNEFRGMGVLRVMEELLRLSGGYRRGMTRSQIVDAALTVHGTADFPYILADSARKTLLAQYQLANPSYRTWCAPSTTPDFKTMSRDRLSEAPTFKLVRDGAQITLGVMSESREQYALGTYGRGFAFTRQMAINDDLGAFSRLVQQFGQQAARTENATAYAILTANANMADSTALFHANHGNLGTGVIGNTGLDAGVTAMATQKGVDGVSVLNLKAKYLIVPAAKKMTAQTALTATGANIKQSDQNWFAGQLEVVADAELDGTSTIVWYLAADPSIAPFVEYAHLEGAEGPQVVQAENENGVLGVTIRAWIDFAAKAVDWRSGYKSSGA